jgi:1-acyl-sn-glycerol-3-phosphate acyltransferase
MVYAFLKWFVGIGLRLYFRKIYISGIENAPTDKPLLMACNHPAGFLEPILLACQFPRPLYFLTRGDLFYNKFIRPLLVSTNQIPIFRFKDGFSNLRNNSKSVENLVKVLKGNNPLLIFVEGSTLSPWELRPMKKGMARMALESLEAAPDLDPYIVPVGITITRSHMPGSDVYLNIGKPFPVKDLNPGNNSTYFKSFNEKLYPLIQEEIIHLPSRANEALLKRWLDLEITSQKYNQFPLVENQKNNFLSLKQKAELLNQAEETATAVLRKEIIQLEKEIFSKKYQLPLNGIRKNGMKWIFLLLGFFGFLFHLIPAFLSGSVTRKNVTSTEFFGAVLLASFLFISLLWYVLVFIVLVSLKSLLIGIFIMVIAFMSGIAFRHYWYLNNTVKSSDLSDDWINRVKNLSNIFN